MARFGQAFINQLTNPSYSQGMFNLGATIGSAPAVAAEKEERQGMLQQLQTAMSSNDPDIIEQASRAVLKTDPELGVELAGRANELRSTKRLQNAQGGLAYLQNQMQTVLKDTSLSPEEQQNKLNTLQESANAIGRTVPGLDPSAIGSLSLKTENEVFQQQEARRQSERADESLSLRFKSFGLQKDQARMAAEKHAEWSNTANYRQTIRETTQQEAQYKQAIQLAKGLVTVEGGRDKFLEAHPEKAGVFDAIAKDQEAKDLKLKMLRANSKNNEFNYSDSELMDILQIPKDASEEKTKEAQSAIEALKRIAKVNPSKANDVLENYVSKQLIGRKIPSAAIANLFKEAALSYAQNTNIAEGIDTDEEEEGFAAKLALKAADAFVNGASIEEAMLTFSATSVESQSKNEDTEDTEDMDIDVEIENIARSLTDGS